jgi:hypothetical protein
VGTRQRGRTTRRRRRRTRVVWVAGGDGEEEGAVEAGGGGVRGEEAGGPSSSSLARLLLISAPSCKKVVRYVYAVIFVSVACAHACVCMASRQMDAVLLLALDGILAHMHACVHADAYVRRVPALASPAAMYGVVKEAERSICNGVKPDRSQICFPEPTLVFEPTAKDDDSQSDDDRRSPTPPGERVTRSRLGGGSERALGRGGASAGERGGRFGRGRAGRGGKKSGTGRGRWPQGASARAGRGVGEDGDGEDEDRMGGYEGGEVMSQAMSGKALHGACEAPKYQTGGDMEEKESEVVEDLNTFKGMDVWQLMHAQGEFKPVQLMPEDECFYVACQEGEDSISAREQGAEKSEVVGMYVNKDEGAKMEDGDEAVQKRKMANADEGDVVNETEVGQNDEKGRAKVSEGAGEAEKQTEGRTKATFDDAFKPRKQGAGTKVMFGNLSFYLFFRLYQKMYERLKKAKDLAIAMDERKQRDKDEKVWFQFPFPHPCPSFRACIWCTSDTDGCRQALELSMQAEKQQHNALRGDNPHSIESVSADTEGAEDGGGGGAGGSKDGGEGAGAEEEDEQASMLTAKACEEEEELFESYEVARLKGGVGGRWSKKKSGGGRWGKKVVVEEEEPVPEGANTFERFMHFLSRLIKGSLDPSDFEESCRITLGTSSYELFTLDWLTSQLRTLAKTLVTVDADGAGAGEMAGDGAAFLALSEYHWIVRERDAVLAARTEAQVVENAKTAAQEEAISQGLGAEDAAMIGEMASAAEVTASQGREAGRQCLLADLEEANAKRLAGKGGCYAFYYDLGAGQLTISFHLLDNKVVQCLSV